ncbi:MAG TPA: hypothetical protein VM618_02670 [Acidimicrobiia bacterium]|nr:hypothetical protein [Acidimicrobiia bacterium]
MRSSEGEALAEELVAAAGGRERWREADRLAVEFSSGGLAFATKRQPRALVGVTGEVVVSRQQVRLAGSDPNPWSIEVSGSAEMRARLDQVARRPVWDAWQPEDVGVFAAAAMWTYLAIPFVLLDEAYGLEVLRPRAGLRRLAVTMPPGVVSHSRRQILHVDGHGLVRRHDYTAETFGRWARASQSLDGHTEFGGLVVATKRRVTPRLVGRRLPGPGLVWIDVAAVRVSRPSRPGEPRRG